MFGFARITSIGQTEAVQYHGLSAKEIVILHVAGYVLHLLMFLVRKKNKLIIIMIKPINTADIGQILKSLIWLYAVK